jgi:lipase chaperone LimK
MAPFNVYNTDLFEQAAEPNSRMIKFLLNDRGIAFFSANQQHREVKLPGLSYEDDYKGDALAGTFQAGRADIRFHQAFSDEKVRRLWKNVFQRLPLVESANVRVFYQGRELS